MTKYKINYHKYLTGAGVLLLENYNNRWIVILFKDHTKKYSDIGGTYESKHIDIKDTAMDELAEESRKIFILDNKNLLQKYVDVKYDSNKDDFYRTYLLNITNYSFFNY